MATRVAITGVGAVTPLGCGARTLLDRWVAGECGIEDGVGRCGDFDPACAMTAKEVRRTDRFSQLVVAASQEALEDAGWSRGLPYDPERVGCVVGTGVGGIITIEREHRSLIDRGIKGVSPLVVPMLMPNAAAAMIAVRYGFRGPSYGTVSACAAGAHAIGAGLRMIQNGEADAIVAGGCEAALTDLALAGFVRAGAVSKSGVSRPFDARRDGFVLGEGAAVLVLESIEFARRRGVTPLGYVLGYGQTTDAHHLTAPEPSGAGAARAMSLALQDAGVDPQSVDYVNAHGTATELNDVVETKAIKLALGSAATCIPVSSTKSAIGHLLGAAGAVEAAATVLALDRRVAPPTLGYEEPEPGLDLDYVPDPGRRLAPTVSNGVPRAIALSNSFGFGGHNAVLCIAS